QLQRGIGRCVVPGRREPVAVAAEGKGPYWPIGDGLGRPEALGVAEIPEPQAAVLGRGRDRPSVRRKRDRGDLPPGTYWDAIGPIQRPAVEHVDIAGIIGDGEATAVG